jgi:DNA-binding transcriptional MerR regulator
MTMLRPQEKSPEAFRTIGEVAAELDLPQHVLRFWESKFGAVKPLKRGGGRRYYRPDDLELLRGIRALLYRDGMTIRGVQKIIKEQGARYVADMGRAGLRLVPSEPKPDPDPVPLSPAHDFAARNPGGQRLTGDARMRAEELLAELLELKTRLFEARSRAEAAVNGTR